MEQPKPLPIGSIILQYSLPNALIEQMDIIKYEKFYLVFYFNREINTFNYFLIYLKICILEIK